MRGLKRRLIPDVINSLVASFTDAWIETYCRYAERTKPRSHLLQMRGLKRKGIERILPETKVASFTDAWIETYQHDFMRKMEKSHLLQMRGLKQQIIWDNDAYIGRIFYRCVD